MIETLELTEYEQIVLKVINKAFEANGLDFGKVTLERRSSNYLSLLSTVEARPGTDFCRIKAGTNSIWISFDVWCCPEEYTLDNRFSGVTNKNQRHWKINLGSIQNIANVCDLIVNSYLYSSEQAPLGTFNHPDLSELDFSEQQKSAIRQKGNQLSILPEDYIIIDLETTGLDPKWCEIIELSAIRVRDDKIVDTFSSLVKPEEEIGEFITKLTGITNEMLSTAPGIDTALPEFLQFIGTDVVIGHNVNFDVNFIYDYKIKVDGNPFKNDYIDTLRIARKALPELSHHRLKDLAKHFSLDFERQHRAMEDCTMTYHCYLKLKNIISENNISLITKKAKARNITSTITDFEESHPLYGKICVFTGKLEKMSRVEAMQIVANIGGINADNVTKNTNYLVLGNNDFCNTIKNGKSSKQKKAEKLALDGQDIQIISENVFYDMISE